MPATGRIGHKKFIVKAKVPRALPDPWLEILMRADRNGRRIIP